MYHNGTNNDGLLTVAEVASFLNVHMNTVRRWANKDLLTSHRIGPRGDRRFQREDVFSFVANGEVEKGE